MSQKSPNERILFGLKVKQLRQQLQLNFAELGKKTGLSVSYLNEIEKGKKYPRPEKMALLANALGVEEQVLCHGWPDKTLTPVSALLQSNFLNELPLELFGMELQKVAELVASSPAKVGAFISTLIELSRNYTQTEEHFYFGALRTYLELHNNYFEDLEVAAENFSKENKLPAVRPISPGSLAELLEKRFGYHIVGAGLDQYPELSDIRAVFIPVKRKLLLNSSLSDTQRAFQLAKEIGFNYLQLSERANTAKLLRAHSFEEALSHFRAGYFSAALLLKRSAFKADLEKWFRQTTWNNGSYIFHLMEAYRASPEMLLQRMTNLLPAFFGLDKLFILRFIHTPAPEGDHFKIDKELRLQRGNEPAFHTLHEHYCRRWQAISLLQQLRQGDARPELMVRAQRAVFVESGEEYLCITMVSPGSPTAEQNVSLTIGMLVNEELRKKVLFWEDPAIEIRAVNVTCERCPLSNCAERAAAPAVVEARERRRRIQQLLREIEAL